MTDKTCIDVLNNWIDWRCGADIGQPEALDVTVALEHAVARLTELTQGEDK